MTIEELGSALWRNLGDDDHYNMDSLDWLYKSQQESRVQSPESPEVSEEKQSEVTILVDEKLQQLSDLKMEFPDFTKVTLKGQCT